jgi:hypothetical protein
VDELPAFGDLGVFDETFPTFDEEIVFEDVPKEPPSAAAPRGAAAPAAPAPPPPPPPPPRIAPGSLAFITVTDAAGRVLFRRPATAGEVDDAVRSAEEAEREGQAAMDRIAHDRLFAELADLDGDRTP